MNSLRANSATAPPVRSVSFKYSVKIMNPSKKSDFEVLVMKAKERFDSIQSIRSKVECEFKDKVGKLKQIGYTEPGHGLRGKQRWLSSDDDLCTMYETYQGIQEVLLWCFGENKGTKRLLEDQSNENSGAQKIPRTTNYSGHVDTMIDVHEIEQDLKKSKFTDPQYRAWANLINGSVRCK